MKEVKRESSTGQLDSRNINREGHARNFELAVEDS